MPLRERAEAAVERAGDVADPEHERGLVGLAERRRVARERAEARGVVRIRLDSLRERLEPVELACAPRGDRGDSLQLPLGDLLRGAGGVVLRAHVRLERAQELLALRDRLRMGDHLVHVVDRGSRQRQQRMVDAHDRLADEM